MTKVELCDLIDRLRDETFPPVVAQKLIDVARIRESSGKEDAQLDMDGDFAAWIGQVEDDAEISRAHQYPHLLTYSIQSLSLMLDLQSYLASASESEQNFQAIGYRLAESPTALTAIRAAADLHFP